MAPDSPSERLVSLPSEKYVEESRYFATSQPTASLSFLRLAADSTPFSIAFGTVNTIYKNKEEPDSIRWQMLMPLQDRYETLTSETSASQPEVPLVHLQRTHDFSSCRFVLLIHFLDSRW